MFAISLTTIFLTGCSIKGPQQNNFPLSKLQHLITEDGQTTSVSMIADVLKADNFSDLIEGLQPADNLNQNTLSLLERVNTLVQKSDSYALLKDFKLGCSNFYCLALISDTDNVYLQETVKEIEKSLAGRPIANFFCSLPVSNDNGRKEIRVIFNANPTVSDLLAITRGSKTKVN